LWETPAYVHFKKNIISQPKKVVSLNIKPNNHIWVCRKKGDTPRENRYQPSFVVVFPTFLGIYFLYIWDITPVIYLAA
jgi:hypothetical protein